MSFVETSVLKNSTIMLIHAERDDIFMNPDYQRMGGVWTMEKRQLLIDSILNDYDLPKIYFHAYSNEQISKTGKRYAVIDGRQRLETILDFIDGKFPLSKDFQYQRDSTLDLGGLTYGDIAKGFPKIRVKFDSFVLPIVTVSIEGDDLDLIEDMFSRLNEAVPLNAAEKRNAIGGFLVKAITDVAGHQFFQSRVRFRNNRYQHKEAAARFLLLEESFDSGRPIVDTKKVYLDDLARKYHSRGQKHVQRLAAAVNAVLDVMSREFAARDELLLAQGILTVYYIVFKSALNGGMTEKVTRSKLLRFRKKLSDNRDLAVREYAEASFDLLEFDRLNQQGTNDASSIKERTRILAAELGIEIPPQYMMTHGK